MPGTIIRAIKIAEDGPSFHRLPAGAMIRIGPGLPELQEDQGSLPAITSQCREVMAVLRGDHIPGRGPTRTLLPAKIAEASGSFRAAVVRSQPMDRDEAIHPERQGRRVEAWIVGAMWIEGMLIVETLTAETMVREMVAGRGSPLIPIQGRDRIQGLGKTAIPGRAATVPAAPRASRPWN